MKFKLTIDPEQLADVADTLAGNTDGTPPGGSGPLELAGFTSDIQPIEQESSAEPPLAEELSFELAGDETDQLVDPDEDGWGDEEHDDAWDDTFGDP